MPRILFAYIFLGFSCFAADSTSLLRSCAYVHDLPSFTPKSDVRFSMELQDHDGQEVPWTQAIATGSGIRLIAKPSYAGYLYLFQDDGRTSKLVFPNQPADANRVGVGEQKVLEAHVRDPAPKLLFLFSSDPIAGSEKMTFAEAAAYAKERKYCEGFSFSEQTINTSGKNGTSGIDEILRKIQR